MAKENRNITGEDWLAARYGKPKVPENNLKALNTLQQQFWNDTIPVEVSRGVPPARVREAVLSKDDEYLQYIRDQVGREQRIEYKDKNILGKPEFVIRTTSNDKLQEAMELIRDLLGSAADDIEKLNQEYCELPKGKQQWADADDEAGSDEECQHGQETLAQRDSPAHASGYERGTSERKGDRKGDRRGDKGDRGYGRDGKDGYGRKGYRSREGDAKGSHGRGYNREENGEKGERDERGEKGGKRWDSNKGNSRRLDGEKGGKWDRERGDTTGKGEKGPRPEKGGQSEHEDAAVPADATSPVAKQLPTLEKELVEAKHKVRGGFGALFDDDDDVVDSPPAEDESDAEAAEAASPSGGADNTLASDHGSPKASGILGVDEDAGGFATVPIRKKVVSGGWGSPVRSGASKGGRGFNRFEKGDQGKGGKDRSRNGRMDDREGKGKNRNQKGDSRDGRENRNDRKGKGGGQRDGAADAEEEEEDKALAEPRKFNRSNMKNTSSGMSWASLASAPKPPAPPPEDDASPQAEELETDALLDEVNNAKDGDDESPHVHVHDEEMLKMPRVQQNWEDVEDDLPLPAPVQAPRQEVQESRGSWAEEEDDEEDTQIVLPFRDSPSRDRNAVEAESHRTEAVKRNREATEAAEQEAAEQDRMERELEKPAEEQGEHAEEKKADAHLAPEASESDEDDPETGDADELVAEEQTEVQTEEQEVHGDEQAEEHAEEQAESAAEEAASPPVQDEWATKGEKAKPHVGTSSSSTEAVEEQARRRLEKARQEQEQEALVQAEAEIWDSKCKQKKKSKKGGKKAVEDDDALAQDLSEPSVPSREPKPAAAHEKNEIGGLQKEEKNLVKKLRDIEALEKKLRVGTITADSMLKEQREKLVRKSEIERALASVRGHMHGESEGQLEESERRRREEAEEAIKEERRRDADALAEAQAEALRRKEEGARRKKEEADRRRQEEAARRQKEEADQRRQEEAERIREAEARELEQEARRQADAVAKAERRKQEAKKKEAKVAAEVSEAVLTVDEDRGDTDVELLAEKEEADGAVPATGAVAQAPLKRGGVQKLAPKKPLAKASKKAKPGKKSLPGPDTEDIDEVLADAGVTLSERLAFFAWCPCSRRASSKKKR